MCAIFFIDQKEITSIGKLKEYVDVTECSNTLTPEQIKDFPDKACLCGIDPLIVATRMDRLLFCDPAQGFYTFQEREDPTL